MMDPTMTAGDRGPDEESASRMMDAPPTAKLGDWKVEDVSIRAAANGGFIVRCSKKREMPPGKGDSNQPMGPGGQTYKSDEYAYSSLPEALAFVSSEFGGGTSSRSAEASMADGDIKDVY